MAWILGLEACDPSARTAKGETALHLSAVRGDERVCQTLVDGGCPPAAVTLEGKTALHLAAEMGEKKVGEERRGEGRGEVSYGEILWWGVGCGQDKARVKGPCVLRRHRFTSQN